MRERGQMRKAALVALAIAASGCSFSASSESSSDSSAASSKSFSNSISSSSPDGESKSEQAYRQDVGDYTASWARERGAPGDGAEFERGLARIAERHGVTNWEADRATYLGIGRGLRSAGVPPASVPAFQSRFGGTASDVADGPGDSGAESGGPGVAGAPGLPAVSGAPAVPGVSRAELIEQGYADVRS